MSECRRKEMVGGFAKAKQGDTGQIDESDDEREEQASKREVEARGGGGRC